MNATHQIRAFILLCSATLRWQGQRGAGLCSLHVYIKGKHRSEAALQTRSLVVPSRWCFTFLIWLCSNTNDFQQMVRYTTHVPPPLTFTQQSLRRLFITLRLHLLRFAHFSISPFTFNLWKAWNTQARLSGATQRCERRFLFLPALSQKHKAASLKKIRQPLNALKRWELRGLIHSLWLSLMEGDWTVEESREKGWDNNRDEWNGLEKVGWSRVTLFGLDGMFTWDVSQKHSTICVQEKHEPGIISLTRLKLYFIGHSV